MLQPVAKFDNATITRENGTYVITEVTADAVWYPKSQVWCHDFQISKDTDTGLFTLSGTQHQLVYRGWKVQDPTDDATTWTPDRTKLDAYCDKEIQTAQKKYGWPFFRVTRTVYRVREGWVRLKKDIPFNVRTSSIVVFGNA